MTTGKCSGCVPPPTALVTMIFMPIEKGRKKN